MNDFEGKIGSYKLIATEDESLTLWSEAYDENCHSTAGAYQETLHNFIEGCQILNKLKNEGHFSILEVGFGLGIGLKATLESISESGLAQKGLFVSTEIDPQLVEWAKSHTIINNSPEFQYCDLILKNESNLNYYHFKNETLEIIILIGNARDALLEAKKSLLKSKFESIFQDAFSPKKNPELWTLQWFELLKSLANDQCILSTYSASSSVRKTLHHSGWSVFNRKGFGPKRSSTIAKLEGETEENILSNIKSKAIAILDDQVLTGNKSKS